MIQREELIEEILNNMKILRTTKLDSFLEVKLILDNDVLVRISRTYVEKL